VALRAAACSLLFVACAPGFAADAAAKRYQLGETGAVELDVPANWSDAPLVPSKPAPGMLVLRPADGGFLAIVGTFPASLVGVPSDAFPSPKELLAATFGSASPGQYELLSGVREFRAGQGRGYYMMRKLAGVTPYGHKLQLQAFIHIGSQLVSVMADANDEAAFQRVLAVIGKGRFSLE